MITNFQHKIRAEVEQAIMDLRDSRRDDLMGGVGSLSDQEIKEIASAVLDALSAGFRSS